MNVAFLCLGGNIGNRIKNIYASKNAIEQIPCSIISQSGIYETEAWGSNSENKYLNQVIKISTKLSAKKLLWHLLAIEKQLGRKRNTNKNSDRTIDIDILLFNSEISSSTNLELPHPRLHERNFVLKPLNEIAKNEIHPVLKKSISKLLKSSKDTLDVKPYNSESAIKYICIEGNIGSGKTTLAKALAKRLNANFLPEEFDENPLLPLFYENKKLFAFPLEYSFLINRFKQISDTFKTNKKLIVSDYSLYKCLWFAKINLTPKAFTIFKKQFKLILSQLPTPDLIIYLSTSPKNLKQNIKKRGRVYEQTISDTYLNTITKEFNKGFNRLKNIEKLNLTIPSYHSSLESNSIISIQNFIKENFGA